LLRSALVLVGNNSFSADKQGTPVQTRDGPAAVTERKRASFSSEPLPRQANLQHAIRM
jgi:hypothetical protein